jgi:hypothetical protein
MSAAAWGKSSRTAFLKCAVALEIFGDFADPFLMLIVHIHVHVKPDCVEAFSRRRWRMRAPA